MKYLVKRASLMAASLAMVLGLAVVPVSAQHGSDDGTTSGDGTSTSSTSGSGDSSGTSGDSQTTTNTSGSGDHSETEVATTASGDDSDSHSGSGKLRSEAVNLLQ